MAEKHSQTSVSLQDMNTADSSTRVADLWEEPPMEILKHPKVMKPIR